MSEFYNIREQYRVQRTLIIGWITELQSSLSASADEERKKTLGAYIAKLSAIVSLLDHMNQYATEAGDRDNWITAKSAQRFTVRAAVADDLAALSSQNVSVGDNVLRGIAQEIARDVHRKLFDLCLVSVARDESARISIISADLMVVAPDQLPATSPLTTVRLADKAAVIKYFTPA